MFNKKTLLIISSLVVLLALALYFFIQKKPSSIATKPSKQSEPSPSSNSGKNLTSAIVATSDEDIQKYFSEFASQKSAEPLKWLKFYDYQNKPLSLDRFAYAIGVNLEPQLKTLLDFNSYLLYICNDSGETDHGIVMNIKLMPNYKGDLYQDEVKFMRAWENSLFQDTSKIIFPNFNFAQDQLNQTIIFKDGRYRYADVILPDKTAGFIGYNLIDDYVIISSSKSCIEKASEYVFPTSN